MADEDGNPIAQAYLFFGAPVELPRELFTPEPWQWHDAYCRAKGWITSLSESPDFMISHGEWVESRKLLTKEPCAIGYGGQETYRYPFVYLKASKTETWQGPPVPVITQEVTPDQIIQLVKFCQLMKISHGTFGWHLAAFYG